MAALNDQRIPSRLPPASPKTPFTPGLTLYRCSCTAGSITAPLKPDGFKLSTEPFFVEMVRDIVGLYQNPPDKGMVLCVVEKTQFQALDWTQPLLPIGLGYVEGITHDYFRHGHVQGQRQAMVEVPAK